MKVKNNSPKGTVKKIGGKRYKSLGNGNWQGLPKPNPKMKKVKSAPKYKSSSKKGKGGMTKRKYK